VELVIAVPRGSGKVRSLPDLLEPGVRVAVGEPSRCTIGALTRRLLQGEGLYDRFLAKQRERGEMTVIEKHSSALLVPDIVTGHVDAAICYLSDALPSRGRLDIIPIESPRNFAVQPFGIARTSDHKHLLRRLFRRVATSADAFESVGFHSA
jgi:molybdate transport system substrate-binding protein